MSELKVFFYTVVTMIGIILIYNYTVEPNITISPIECFIWYSCTQINVRLFLKEE